jgi:hypothetical protein
VKLRSWEPKVTAAHPAARRARRLLYLIAHNSLDRPARPSDKWSCKETIIMKPTNYAARSRKAIDILKAEGKTIATYYSKTLNRKVTVPGN